MTEFLNNHDMCIVIFLILVAALSVYVYRLKKISNHLQLKDFALNASANAIIITNEKGEIEWANPAFSKLSGYSLEEAIGQKPQTLFKTGLQSEAYYQKLWSTILAGNVWQGELLNRRKDNTTYIEEITITPLPNLKGKITHFIAIKQDISQRKQMETELLEQRQELKLKEARFHGLFDQSAFLAGVLNKDCQLIEVNQRALDLIGANRRDVLGKYFPETPWWTNEREKSMLVLALNQALSGEISSFEAEHLGVTGEITYVIFTATPIFLENDIQIEVTGLDITKRRIMEMTLRDNLATLKSRHNALDQIYQGVTITDVNRQITYVNEAFLKLSGYSREELLGCPLTILQGEATSPFTIAEMKNALDNQKPFCGEILNYRKNGTQFWNELSITPVFDDAGKLTQFVGVQLDITARKQSEQEVQNMAFYDPLTQLPNRRLLMNRLAIAIALSQRSDKYGAVMFMDLDNFKPLNDNYGHSIGDLLLIEVANRIVGCLRETDVVARFGGDEFVVLLSELNSDFENAKQEAFIVAEKIRKLLATPYALSTKKERDIMSGIVQHRCSSSIGIALFKGKQMSQENVLNAADVAMYQAKENGRNRICFFEQESF